MIPPRSIRHSRSAFNKRRACRRPPIKSDLLYPYVALILPLDQQPRETIPELALKEKIALGAIEGRIDHMAFDAARKRLFVAELGNNSLGVVDLQGPRLETRR
jgi:hypothetical protein